MAVMFTRPGKVATRKRCFDLLDDYLLSIILEMVTDPRDRLAVRLVCRRFLAVQASSRCKMQVLRPLILTTALGRYTEVKHLDLSPSPQVRDEDLDVVGDLAGSRLQSINLSCVAGFSKLGIMGLASRCMCLKEMDLSNCLHLGDEEMYAISLLSNLEHLKLTNCRGITDTGLSAVAEGCPKLQQLSLKQCTGIADDGVVAIAEHCRHLEDLDLSYTEVTGVGFLKVALLANLKNLTMVGCNNLDNNGFGWLGENCDPVLGWNRLGKESLRSLEVIKLDGCAIMGTELSFIGKGPVCRTLKELSLSKCTGVTDEGLFSVLKGCVKLERLDLTCCGEITDKTMSFIAQFCNQLRSLKMESCSWMTEQGIAQIGMHCPLVEELDLTDCNVNDQCLEKLANCKALRILKLAICTQITDVGLQYIGATCGELKEIDLYRSAEVGDLGIEALANGCPNLSVINISYCSKLTDVSLCSLSKLRELKSLEMRSLMTVTCDGLLTLASGCRKLEKIDLKRCFAIMDWGIRALAENCINLRQICLSYCWMITDDGLRAIASSSHMQVMSLLHLDEVNIQAFEDALIGCHSLQKVKISAHLKEKFSEQTVRLLERRGCRIKWLEKPSLDQFFLFPSN